MPRSAAYRSSYCWSQLLPCSPLRCPRRMCPASRPGPPLQAATSRSTLNGTRLTTPARPSPATTCSTGSGISVSSSKPTTVGRRRPRSSQASGEASTIRCRCGRGTLTEPVFGLSQGRPGLGPTGPLSSMRIPSPTASAWMRGSSQVKRIGSAVHRHRSRRGHSLIHLGR